MRKTLFVIILIALVAAIGYHFYQTKNKSNKENGSTVSQIRIAYNAESVSNAPIIIAYEKQYFQKHHLDPQMIPLKSGKETTQAMSAGQADIGIGGIANFVPAMAKGAPIRFFAASASSPSFIFVRPNENMNGFSDLYGKTISVTSNGINDLIFRIVMSQEDIDTAKIKYADIERAYNVVALMEKKAVDAAIVSEQDTEMFIKAGAVLLPEWGEKGYDKQAMPRNSLAIHLDFLSQNEEAAKNFLEAIIDAHRLIKNNPQEAAETLAKHIGEKSSGAVNHSPEKIVEQWKNDEITNVIWQNPDITMALVKKTRELGTIDRDLSVQEVFDLKFEKKLNAAQQEIYGR